MDFTLQLHQAKYVFPVPDGLKELSSDIIREVLRHQPEHINGFIADYLETMLIVRENARDAGILICDTFRQGFFFDELFKLKNVTRDQANHYAVIIQSAWRGYLVRRKLGEWLQKKKKFEEEKDRKRSLKIEELLAGLGITYSEATRAANIIQTAYKDSKRGKWLKNEYGEFWVGEAVPFGQRIREGDRALGRYDRWDKEDFGDFFEMDEAGAIKYVWPKIGQLRKVLREEIPCDMNVVEFFAMRDLQGREQYSYLIKTLVGAETRGIPIGFLTPMPKSMVVDSPHEVEFVEPDNVIRMGHYTYVYRDDCTREDLLKFDELLKAHSKAPEDVLPEVAGEFDYDPHWVLPRALIRIKKEYLLETDHEVRFAALPAIVICEEQSYKFRAETVELTAKLIRQILREKCTSVQDGLLEAGNMVPYRVQETGRIFPVDSFLNPQFIQKIKIIPESPTGEEDTVEFGRFAYVFLPIGDAKTSKLGTKEPLMEIPISRFQGYHSDYRGSADLENKVMIMGPRITTPNGKPFTYESLFWEEFGEEAWHQLLYTIAMQSSLDEEEEQEIPGEELEGGEEESETSGEKDFESKPTSWGDKSTDRSQATESVKAPPEAGQAAKGPTTPAPASSQEIPGEGKDEGKEEAHGEEKQKEE